MDIDEMRQLWELRDRQLGESLRLNEQLLRAARLSRARSQLQQTTVFLVLESIVWFAIVFALGNFLHNHSKQPLFALPAAACDVYAIGALGATIRLCVEIRRIDCQGPITTTQRQLEAACMLRIYTCLWQLLGGIVVWAPFAIVTAKAILGFDTFNVPWLCANIILGIAIIPLAIWSARKFNGSLGDYPLIQGLIKDVAGQSLSAAREFLASLTEFEIEAV